HRATLTAPRRVADCQTLSLAIPCEELYLPAMAECSLQSKESACGGGRIMATAQLTTINPSNTINHYKAYKPRPFKREERDKVTILYGGLTWKHERLMQGALHNLKYNAEPLPNITREDLDAGKELIDVGACCPTIFATGSLVNLLKTKVAA